MSITLHEVMSAADKRAAALAAEVSGYLLLAVADQVAGAPRVVGIDEIALSQEGAVRVGSSRPAEDPVAEASLRSLLAEMLLISSSVTPGLRRAGQRAAGAGVDAFIRELEAALIPVNRGAAKRALSRLHRDVTRAKAARPLEPYRLRVVASAPADSPPTSAPSAGEDKSVLPASVELPLAVLGGADSVAASVPADVDRSWLSPETIAVTEISWPGRVFPREPEPEPVVEAAPEDETIIPIFVEEYLEPEHEALTDDMPTPHMAEPEAGLAPVATDAMPEVPDLDVVPSPFPPLQLEERPTNDRETVPQPAVVRRAEREQAEQEAIEAAPKTPPLGTLVAELDPPPWPLDPPEPPPPTPDLPRAVEVTAPVPAVLPRAIEVTAPVPAVLELVAEEATDRVPAAELLSPQDFTEKIPEAIDRALARVARAFEEPDLIEAIDANWSPSPSPAKLTPILSEADWIEIAPEILLAGDRDPEPEAAPEPESVAEPEPKPEPEPVAETAAEPKPEPEPEPEPEPAVQTKAADEAKPDPDPCPIDESPAPPEFLAIDFEPHEIFEVEEAPVEPLADLEANATPDDESDFAPPLELELSPLPQIDVNSIETLAVLPRRPEPSGYAPPRYAPKASDVDALLRGFSVAEGRTERELCRDLKTLAGIDATQPPPAVELSRTPPPVDLSDGRAVADSEPTASRLSSARVVAGAVSVALVLAGLGFGSIPTRAASAAAATLDVQPCAAELAVQELPPGAKARVRLGSGRLVEPARIRGNEAVFAGLACEESADVTIALDGTGHWLVIPVAASDLTPSADRPSFVRHAVIAR